MTELDHKTFDLGQVLAGVGFPEEEVTVFFDESVGYEIFKAEETLRLAEIRGNEEQLKDLDEKIQALKEKAKQSAYKITLRGLPESTRKACDAKAREKFPVSYSFLNQPEPDPERDDYYNALLWAASIVKVEDPSGAVAVPTEENITALRNAVGRSVVAAISQALSGLMEGAKSGFEKATQDVDFLSEASRVG